MENIEDKFYYDSTHIIFLLSCVKSVIFCFDANNQNKIKSKKWAEPSH